MNTWISGLFGEAVPVYAAYIILFAVAILAILILLWIARRILGGTFVAGGRARHLRLAVMDATPVDSRRRLVLVRRDDVEHLILIGGPTDVVVEHNIKLAGSTVARQPTQSAFEDNAPQARQETSQLAVSGLPVAPPPPPTEPARPTAPTPPARPVAPLPPRPAPAPVAPTPRPTAPAPFTPAAAPPARPYVPPTSGPAASVGLQSPSFKPAARPEPALQPAAAAVVATQPASSAPKEIAVPASGQAAEPQIPGSAPTAPARELPPLPDPNDSLLLDLTEEIARATSAESDAPEISLEEEMESLLADLDTKTERR